MASASHFQHLLVVLGNLCRNAHMAMQRITLLNQRYKVNPDFVRMISRFLLQQLCLQVLQARSYPMLLNKPSTTQTCLALGITLPQILATSLEGRPSHIPSTLLTHVARLIQVQSDRPGLILWAGSNHRSNVNQRSKPRNVLAMKPVRVCIVMSFRVPSAWLIYLACIPCRRKKVGCDLRQPGNNYDPPCQRCRSENIRCSFAGKESIANNASRSSLPSLSQLACPHCSLVFLREDDLRTHLRTQCAEKHYVCTTCNSRFRRLNDLDRHSRIHTGERPHTCEICKRRFSRATTLTRHRQGPDGCAGRRADLGRRRLGSFQGPSPDDAADSDTMLLTQPRYSQKDPGS